MSAISRIPLCGLSILSYVLLPCHDQYTVDDFTLRLTGTSVYLSHHLLHYWVKRMNVGATSNEQYPVAVLTRS
jgi:hypothetical protein